jgi:HEAT repeat protein
MNNDRLNQLESLLRSNSLMERKSALDELAQCPSDLAVPILQKLAAEPDFLRRRLAIMGLGNHRTPESLAVLKNCLEQEQDDNVLSEIANSLFEFGEVAVPLLQQLFKLNYNWLTRQTIISILMESDRHDALLDVIRTGLQDETQTVKETAILALGKLLNGNFHQEAMALLSALTDAPDWRDRWRSATALCLAHDPNAKILLAKLQRDPNHYVVAAALEAGFGIE